MRALGGNGMKEWDCTGCLPEGAEKKTLRKEEERRKQPPLSINSNAINQFNDQEIFGFLKLSLS